MGVFPWYTKSLVWVSRSQRTVQHHGWLGSRSVFQPLVFSTEVCPVKAVTSLSLSGKFETTDDLEILLDASFMIFFSVQLL